MSNSLYDIVTWDHIIHNVESFIDALRPQQEHRGSVQWQNVYHSTFLLECEEALYDTNQNYERSFFMVNKLNIPTKNKLNIPTADS